jgi:Icc-related predicted phosphoesterase
MDLSILYVADIHGSDRCFRKWLNAGTHYGVDILIVGGDLTGKILVPVYRSNGRWSATWDGDDLTFETEDEFAAFARRLREHGVYAHLSSPEEVAAIRGSVELERAAFATHKVAQLREWIDLADSRLAGTSIRAYIMAGNDDPIDVDGVLDSGTLIQDVGDRVTELAPGVLMASIGESTPTPWNTPRELSDEALGEKMAEVVAGLPETGTTIWNFHMPPFDTGVDVVPRLDDQLRVQYRAGQPDMIPVGARSLRALIAERQPTLALHGHIHEGRGRYTIGSTVGFNPGSQYQDGVLLGVIVRISPKRGLRSYSFVAG